VSIPSIVAAGRRLIATTLLDRCRIQDRAVTRDSTGGKSEVFTERGADLNCRFVQPKDNDPAIELGSVFGRIEMILEVAIGTDDFSEGDRVRNVTQDGLWRIVRNITPPSTIATVGRYGIAQEVI
jgi:hypothetical protein